MENAILLYDLTLLMPMHKSERGLCVCCRELTYYEKWARSLAVILKERGTITQSELDAALGHDDKEAPAIKYACSPVLLHFSYPLPGVLPKQHICQTEQPSIGSTMGMQRMRGSILCTTATATFSFVAGSL